LPARRTSQSFSLGGKPARSERGGANLATVIDGALICVGQLGALPT
jgi:hypothetical protein